MSDNNALTDAAMEVLRNGALDLDATLNYTHVHRIFDRHGVPFGGTREEYTMLEQAARNVMVERRNRRVHDLGSSDCDVR